jgi:hypothetical protein
LNWEKKDGFLGAFQLDPPGGFKYTYRIELNSFLSIGGKEWLKNP